MPSFRSVTYNDTANSEPQAVLYNNAIARPATAKADAAGGELGAVLDSNVIRATAIRVRRNSKVDCTFQNRSMLSYFADDPVAIAMPHSSGFAGTDDTPIVTITRNNNFVFGEHVSPFGSNVAEVPGVDTTACSFLDAYTNLFLDAYTNIGMAHGVREPMKKAIGVVVPSDIPGMRMPAYESLNSVIHVWSSSLMDFSDTLRPLGMRQDRDVVPPLQPGDQLVSPMYRPVAESELELFGEALARSLSQTPLHPVVQIFAQGIAGERWPSVITVESANEIVENRY